MLRVGPVTSQFSEETSKASVLIGNISFAFTDIFYTLASLGHVGARKIVTQLPWERFQNLIVCMVVARSYSFLLFRHYVLLIYVYCSVYMYISIACRHTYTLYVSIHTHILHVHVIVYIHVHKHVHVHCTYSVL